MRSKIAAVAGLALLTACGQAGAAPTPPGSAPPVGLPTVAGPGWLTYHRDLARTGVDSTGPPFRSPRVAWRSAELDGDLYAEPLVSGDLVVVATENDSLYALDASSGRQRWRRHLGEPMLGSKLACGNIPISGITSTPVIDPRTSLVYAVGFLQPGRHVLFALDLTSGAVRFQRPVDPPGADPLVHQQRAAIALVGDTVYVAFGGLYGDCGDYRGAIVGVRADGSGPALGYRVPAQREGAIWAPSGIAADSGGSLFVATGNTPAAGAFDFGNTVIRLSPDLRVLDWFAPVDWRQLSQQDLDLGSVGPALLGQTLVFAIGKAGVGYLLRADHLGGVGGQVFSASVCPSAYGGTAFSPPLLYVPCTTGLYALRVSGGSFSAAWRAPVAPAGPPILAGGAVWAYDTDRGTLFALDPLTGHERWRQRLGVVTRFTTPAASGGTVYAAGDRSIVAVTW